MSCSVSNSGSSTSQQRCVDPDVQRQLDTSFSSESEIVPTPPAAASGFEANWSISSQLGSGSEVSGNLLAEVWLAAFRSRSSYDRIFSSAGSAGSTREMSGLGRLRLRQGCVLGVAR